MNIPAKASRNVSSGDVIKVRKMPVIYSYRVKEPIEKRVGPKIVHLMWRISPRRRSWTNWMMQDDFYVKRDRGTGRPTKKDRRLLDDISDS